ncbi:MAG TPA: alpha/beta hydrolase, partial [Polyangiales bacterium]
QPMLFAHGYGCDQTMWRFVVPAFEATHRTIVFDHVGSGRSDLQAYDFNRYARLEGYARDVLEICEAMELRDVVFVGHSVSAMIGVLAARMQAERFSSLILVGPSPRYLDDVGYVGGFSQRQMDELLDALDDNYLGWSSSVAPLIMGNNDRPELGRELTNSFCRTDPAIARHFARVTFLSDNRADLPEVKTRSLVLQCSEDVIAPRAVGEYVHRQLSNSQLTIMRATGHCPNLSAPDETIRCMQKFLHN